MGEANTASITRPREEESPTAPSPGPATKRARTSVASGIPGIADVPVSPAARASFFNITSNLVALGAKPVDQMEKQLEEYDRNEALELINGQEQVTDDEDSDEDGAQVVKQLVSPEKSSTQDHNGQRDVDMSSIDGVELPAASNGGPAHTTSGAETLAGDAKGGNEEPVDDRVAFPTRYLGEKWRLVTKLHAPRYELSVSRQNPQTYGCTLHLHVPPSSTRSYTVESTYPTKRAAKDAASATAIKAGALEKGLEARKAAGEEVWEGGRARGVEAVTKEGGDPWDTVDNPSGLLHQGFQRYMPIAKFEWEYETNTATNLHAPTLHVPITADLTKHYSLPCTFTSRREARDALARVALRDNILGLYEEAFKARLEVDSGGYLSFGGAQGAGGKKQSNPRDTDAISTLNAAVMEAFAGVKGMKWHFLTEEKPLDAEKLKALADAERLNPGVTPSASASAPVQLFGVTLNLTLHPPSPFAARPDGTISYTVPPIHHTRQHARQACAALALKEGVVEVVKQAKREWGPQAGKGAEKRSERGSDQTPAPGSVSKEGLKALVNGTAYLNTCFQQWSGTTAPLTFEFTTSDEGDKFGCTLTILPSASLPVKKYTTPPTHSSKKNAKEAVVQMAFADGVLDLVKPKEIDPSRGTWGPNRGRGAMRGAMRGGARGGSGPGGGRGGFGGGAPTQQQQQYGTPNSHNGYGTPHQNGYDGGFGNNYGGTPSRNGSSFGGSDHSDRNSGWGQQQSPYQQQQQQQGYYPPAPQPPPQQQQYNHQLFGPVSHGGAGGQQDMIAYFDDFCRTWMGPGAPLPAYDLRQSPQNGLFGAVVRLSLPPDGRITKAYWVDFDFHTRADAQEAVARIAVMDGVVEQIRREVPQYTPMPVQPRGGAGFPTPPSQGPRGGRGPPPAMHQQQQQQYPQGPTPEYQPPPHLQHQQGPPHQQQPAQPPQLRPSGRQPLPPQGSPQVGPPPRGKNQPPPFQQPHPQVPRAVVPKKSAPPAPTAVANKAVPAPAAAPAPVVSKPNPPPPAPVAVAEKRKQQQQPEPMDEDGPPQSKKPNSSGLLNTTFQVLFGDKPERRPVYEVQDADSTGRFSASLRIALSSSTPPLSYATPSIYSSKREARAAVASLAISEGAVDKMKATAAAEWQASFLVPTAAAVAPVVSAPPAVVKQAAVSTVSAEGSATVAPKGSGEGSASVAHYGGRGVGALGGDVVAGAREPAPILELVSEVSAAAPSTDSDETKKQEKGSTGMDVDAPVSDKQSAEPEPESIIQTRASRRKAVEATTEPQPSPVKPKQVEVTALPQAEEVEVKASPKPKVSQKKKVVAEEKSSQVEPAPKAAVPSNIKAVPAVASSVPATAPVSSKKRVDELNAFCKKHGYPLPVYASESQSTTAAGDGSISTTGFRVWCTIGETRFEIPSPKSIEAGQRNLAIRVQKHLEMEVNAGGPATTK